MRILLLLLIFLSPISAQASKHQPHGVGDVIPKIEAKDQSNDLKKYSDIVGDKGAILIFYRSVDWCPFCQKQLKEFSALKNEFTQKGYNIIGISYDSVESLKRFDAKNKLGFTLLNDENSNMIRSFGILNMDVAEGSKAYGTPNPAVYVADKDGLITHVFKEEGYKARPDIRNIIDAL